MGRKKDLQKHQEVDYNKRFKSREEAMRSADVKKAAKHHKVNLCSLVGILASCGCKIIVAILRLLAVSVLNGGGS